MMNFTESQTTAIETINVPCLIQAGAGSGKTRVIVEKAKRAYLSSIPPEQIAALTFTKKAAAEMRERLFKDIGIDAYKTIICSWHSFAFNQVIKPASDKKHPLLAQIGYSSDVIIFDESESRMTLNECVKEVLNKDEIEAFNEAGGVRRLENEMGFALSYGRTVKYQDKWLKEKWKKCPVERSEELLWYSYLTVWKLYEKKLFSMNAIDYNYMLVIAVFLLEKDKTLRQWLSGFLKVILADEHQDCNPIQGRFLKLVAGAGTNLTMVGDDKQSIYGFRAADITQILNASRDYQGIKVITLPDNFRSSPEIITLANSITDLMDESQKISEGHMKPNKPSKGIKPVVREFFSDDEEAEVITNEIKSILDSKLCNPSDIAILYRNKAIKDKIENCLLSHHIDYQVVGDKDFFDAKEVKDWMAFLRFCGNDADIMAASRVIDGCYISSRGVTMRQNIANGKYENPIAYIKHQTQAGGPKSQLKRDGFSALLESQQCINEAIKECGSKLEYAQLNGISDESEEAREGWDQVTQGLKSALMEIWEHLFKPKYFEEAEKQVSKGAKKDAKEVVDGRKKNVEVLTERLFAFLEEQGHLLDCIRELVLLVDSGGNEEQAVQLMTEHASKGLEFERVYVIGCEDEAHFKSDDTDMNEELRLFYVAVTRAIEHLSISYCNQRFIYGDVSQRKPLRFIEQIPSENYDTPMVPKVQQKPTSYNQRNVASNHSRAQQQMNNAMNEAALLIDVECSNNPIEAFVMSCSDAQSKENEVVRVEGFKL